MRRIGDHAGASDSLTIHLSRLCIRWMMHHNDQKPAHLRLAPERMAVTWPEALRALARVTAIERMHELEPEEATKFEQMQRENKAELDKNAAGSVHYREKLKRDAIKAENVFLSRFFPIPPPREWNPGFWSRRDTMYLARRLAAAVDAVPVSEPSWYPDGWEESVMLLKGAK